MTSPKTKVVNPHTPLGTQDGSIIYDSVLADELGTDRDINKIEYMMGLTTIYDKVNNRRYSLNSMYVFVDDLSSKTMEILSGPGIPDSSHTLVSAVSFILDSVNDRLLVIDNKLRTIIAVDLVNVKESFLKF